MSSLAGTWRALWAWAGRVDDALGRWKVIRWVAISVGGSLLITGVLLVRTFGLWWSAVIALGAIAIGVGVIGLIRERGHSRAQVPPETHAEALQDRRLTHLKDRLSFGHILLARCPRSPLVVPDNKLRADVSAWADQVSENLASYPELLEQFSSASSDPFTRMIYGSSGELRSGLEHQLRMLEVIIRHLESAAPLDASQVATGWKPAHHYWPSTEFGGPGVFLTLASSSGDRRKNAWCLVTAPGDARYEADMTSAFVPQAHHLTPRNSFPFMYPRDFANAPPPPLAEGDYRVEWHGDSGVGRQFLAGDCFRVAQGRLLNCDGTEAENALANLMDE